MDTVKIGRNLANRAFVIGLGLAISPFAVFVLWIIFPSSAPTDGGLLLTVFMIFIFVGVLGVTLGGLFGLVYWIEERRALKKINKFGESEISTRFSYELEKLPATILLDSLDRAILAAVRESGGDILVIDSVLSNRAEGQDDDSRYRRIANLQKLGMLVLPKRKIFLTAYGLEALDTPIVLFSSKIPHRVREHAFDVKVCLRSGRWGDVVLQSFKALEAAYKHLARSESEKNSDIALQIKEKETKKKKKIERWTVGELYNLMIAPLKLLKPKTFENWLSNRIVAYKPKTHDTESRVYTPQDAEMVDIYLGILLRLLFG